MAGAYNYYYIKDHIIIAHLNYGHSLAKRSKEDIINNKFGEGDVYKARPQYKFSEGQVLEYYDYYSLIKVKFNYKK